MIILEVFTIDLVTYFLEKMGQDDRIRDIQTIDQVDVLSGDG